MKVRDLLVTIGFKTDEAALERLDKRIGSLKTQLLGLTAAGVAGAAALFGIAKATANAGDEARDAAMRLGITAEAYQELAYAASLSGASIGDVGIGIKRLATLLESAKTKGGAAADVLRKVGLDPTQTIASDKALEQLADRFASMPNGTAKAALAVELFGRSGMRLIPLLNEGSAGIRKMRLEAVDLGAVISNETADASDAFNDSLEALTFASKGLVYTIGAELLPVMTEAMDGMIAWWKANRAVVQVKIREWTQRLIVVLKAAGRTAVAVGKRVSAMIDSMGGLEAVAQKVAIALALAFGAKMLTNIVGIGEALFVAAKGLKAVGVALGVGSGIIGLVALGVAWNILLIQDAITAYTGGDSVIGRFYSHFENGMPFIKAAGDLIVSIGGLVKSVFVAGFTLASNVLKTFGIDISGIGEIVSYLANVQLGALAEMFRTLKGWIDAAAAAIDNFPAALDRAGKATGNFLGTRGNNGILGRAWDAAPGVGGTLVGAVTDPVGSLVRSVFPSPVAGPAAGGATVSAGDITVNVPASSGSPKAVGREVRSGVLAALEDAARRARLNYAAGEE